jgi:signal transduction histidine kinase
MHTQFLAGVVFAWVISYIGIGLSFSIAYLIHRREPEHLLFGLHSLALAIYSIGLTLAYTQSDPSGARFAVLIALGGAILACPLIVHFALLFARVRNPLPYVRPVYAGAFAFEIANAAGMIAKVGDAAPVIVRIGPVTVEHMSVECTPLGVVLSCMVIVAAIATLGLLVSATVSGRRDGIVPLLGGACMCATTIHDALLAMGLAGGTWLASFGNSAFVFSIAGAFLVRSSTLSKELTDQSLELTRRTGELQHSYEELREAQRELTRREQLAAVGELAAVIAHEVRNPLAIISNAVAGLRRREIGHEDRETLLAILKEESSRLNRLVGDLLRYARPVNVQRQLISVREVIERTLTSTGLRETMAVELAEVGEIHPIWGDPGLLRQVFDNLIENAVQAMTGIGGESAPKIPTRGAPTLTISVRTARRDTVEGVQVDVQDVGEGMDAQVRLRAKDPFFTTRPSGTGLGLAIVDRIVDAHDGELSINSQSGEGTTVSVFLPVGAPVPPSSGALIASREGMMESAARASERP